jgi:uncharacterized membrane protein
MPNLVLCAVLFLLAIALLVILFVVARPGRHPAGTGDAFPSDSDKPPADRYYLKMFYANPDDPRGVVPKRWGIGWTVNFRTRAMARLFTILLATTIVLTALLASGVLGAR